MGAPAEVTLVRSADNYTFQFRGVSNWNDSKGQTSFKFPLPASDETKALLMKLEGQEREISFTFKLFDDNTDCSGGTPGAITTVTQQYTYLMDTFYRKSTSDKWTITETTAAPGGKLINIEKIELGSMNAPSSLLITGSIKLVFGDVKT